MAAFEITAGIVALGGTLVTSFKILTSVFSMFVEKIGEEKKSNLKILTSKK